MASQKIDPLSVIRSHTPTPEQPKSASSWFKTERMELDFGDYVGRPNENVTAHKEVLSQLLQQGWYVTEVSNGGSEGEWKKVSSQQKSGTSTESGTKSATEDGSRKVVGKTSKTGSESGVRNATESKTGTGEATAETVGKETGGTSEKSTAESTSHSEAQGFSNSNNSYSSYTNSTGSKGQTSGGGTSAGTTISNSTNDANGTSSSESTSSSLDGEATESVTKMSTEETSGKSDETSKRESKEDGSEETSETTGGSQNETSSATSSDSETVTADETDPYWSAWQRIRLERRRMQAELVLQSMVDTFVSNFNEGRQINVDRYEELVALYALMVSQTQDDAANIDLDSIDFEPLFDEVKRAITEKLSQYQNVADAIPSDWLESRKADINLKFDNLVSEAQAKMITDGTYNGIVWPSVLAGIEHQRSHALDALKDEAVGLKLNAYGDIAKTTSALYSQMIDAETRVFEALKSKKTTPITLRNEVLKWMYDFMERRTDDHVKVSELATLVQQLGYEGGIGAPASVSS